MTNFHFTLVTLRDKPAGATVTSASDKFESGTLSNMKDNGADKGQQTDIVPLFGSGENCFDRLNRMKIAGEQEIVVE